MATMRLGAMVLASSAISSLLWALTAGAQPAPSTTMTTQPSVQASPPVVSEEANRLIKNMGEYIGSAQSFTFHADITFDHVLPSGQKLQFSASEDVALQRPSGLRVVWSGDLGSREFWYDGKTVTVYDPATPCYAREAVSTDIDGMLDTVVTKMGFSPPLSDFLYSDPPLLFGTLYGLAFGYAMIPAIVIGSLLASHTLLALSTVIRLGAIQLEPVIVVIGATVVSDTLSLIVFAICVSTYTTGFSLSGIAIQIAEIVVFVPLILIALSRAGAYMLSRLRENEEASFVVMLCIMVVAGTIADLINLPGIVGAFLAGLAVNAAVHDHPAKAKLEFFGQALFIPSFFIVTGFLIDPVEFFQNTIHNFPLVLGIVAALLIGKWIAAEAVGRAFGYDKAARQTMWALTLPQVAATLAATLVAYDTRNAEGQRMLDSTMLNTVLVLMLVTSILGPMLTERFAPSMLAHADRN